MLYPGVGGICILSFDSDSNVNVVDTTLFHPFVSSDLHTMLMGFTLDCFHESLTRPMVIEKPCKTFCEERELVPDMLATTCVLVKFICGDEIAVGLRKNPPGKSNASVVSTLMLKEEGVAFGRTRTNELSVKFSIDK